MREGKHTVLFAHAIQRATPAQLAYLRSWHGNQELTEEQADELRGILLNTGALAEVEDMIDQRVREAAKALDAAPITSEARDALTVLADQLAHRDR
jgi:geranylgeranyl diphosphate synthase type I